GDERVEREQAERGRTVDEDPVEVLAQRLEQTPQPALAVDEAHKLDVGAGETAVSGHDLQVVDGARDDEARRIEGRVALERAVYRAARGLLPTQPDAACRVALRIEVDEQHLLVGERERGREIDGGRGLPYPALLIGNRDDSSHIRSYDLLPCLDCA